MNLDTVSIRELMLCLFVFVFQESLNLWTSRNSR